ncbi:MAG: transglutaminase domain-containing protein [Fuerstia sp.]|nr:transglutaminase domain-containing protein [Fuerstiella sp.]
MNLRIVMSLMCLVVARASADDGLDRQLELQLAASGTNAAEISGALSRVPDDQKASMRFLVAWMNGQDLKQLTADRLLENVALATKVRNLAPWQQQIPDDIFNNFVLPHACFDEPRDLWRADFHDRFWPLVKDCRTASEAAQVLNQKVFAELKVKYSTGRRRANQSPAESIEQGLASCSGLSVILVDACRSVGVPARIAGIPKWANKEGNHTWVEVWDDGWHFAGAAEYDSQGLDRAWFTNDAAQADPESRLSSIYAVKYEPTGIHFPLPWNPGDDSIHAVNVTERYVSKRVDVPEGFTRVLFSAKDRSGKRVALRVQLSQGSDATNPVGSDKKTAGKTRDETRDTNDFLEAVLQKGQTYQITASDEQGKMLAWEFTTSSEEQQMISWEWPSQAAASLDNQ